jgi:hypothetical protein
LRKAWLLHPSLAHADLSLLVALARYAARRWMRDLAFAGGVGPDAAAPLQPTGRRGGDSGIRP